VEVNMEVNEKNITNRTILLLGGLIGLAAGLATAYLLIRNQEKTGRAIKITSSDGMKLGMSTVSLIKQVSDIAIKRR